VDALRMPPTLARPVIHACAFTITGLPISSAMARAYSGVAATRPWGTVTLNCLRKALP